MKTLAKLFLVTTILLLTATRATADEHVDAEEELRIAAMEALITAPPERALPLVNKVLAGNHSDELKERALFILSQLDDPGAQATLLDFATNSSGELQLEAIRMIGIGGDKENLGKLKTIYESGDAEAREAVLEAYMIVGDKQSVYEIAAQAQGDDFEHAVEMLSVMGAREELRQLAAEHGASEALVEAYAISDDFDALRELAFDSSDPEIQVQAIEAMGIIGSDQVNETLVQIYTDSSDEDVREAALDGMLISGNDAGILQLYRSTDDAATRKELLEYLVIMDSEEVWAIIDSALSGDE